jgi:hypothetical protein
LAQLFPKWTNYLPLCAGLAAPVAMTVVVAGVWYFGSPKYTDVGYRPHQPVPYSHALHVGELGLDCRYCHFSVETSPVAVVPPTQTCMNCHHVILRDSAALAPVRESEATGRPLRWSRVHNLPDYAYFHHAVHVHAGVGCISCHGAINEMKEVMQVKPLSMSWCLDCHRNPAPNLRPVDEVTNMEWFAPKGHADWAQAAMAERHIAPPTDCSGCHR